MKEEGAAESGPAGPETGVRRRTDSSRPPPSLGEVLGALELAARGHPHPSAKVAVRTLGEAREVLAELDSALRVRAEDVAHALRPALADLVARLEGGAPMDGLADPLARLARQVRAIVGIHARAQHVGVPQVGLTLRYVRCDLAEATDGLLEPLAGYAAERDVRLSVGVEPGLWMDLDPAHAAELLLGLVGGALRRVEAGGWVRFTAAAADEGWVELQVTDSGSPEDTSGSSPEGSHAAVSDGAALLGGTMRLARAASGGSSIEVGLPRLAPRGVVVGALDDRDRARWRRRRQEVAIAARDALYEGDADTAQTVRRIKQDFLRMMSHELKTPVTAMRLQLRMLEREVALQGSPILVRRLERVGRSKWQLLNIIETMLECSRYDDGTFTPAPVSFDAGDLVREVVSELAAIGPMRLRPATGAVPAAPLVNDRRIVRMILVNLAMHALQRSADAEVELSVRAADGAHTFALHDLGPRMGAAERRAALAPFDVELAARPGRGSGLGLLLVRDLASAIGAHLQIIPPRHITLTVPWPGGDESR